MKKPRACRKQDQLVRAKSSVEIREGMGQLWIADLSDKGRLIAMCTRREDAELLRDAVVCFRANTAATVSAPPAGRNTVGGLVGGTMEAKQ